MRNTDHKNKNIYKPLLQINNKGVIHTQATHSVRLMSILYMFKSKWTPDHHTHMCSLSKLLPLLDFRGQNLLHCVYRAVSSTMTWLAKAAENPDFNPTEQLWDELELRRHPRLPRPASAPDLLKLLLLNEH